VEMLDDKRKEEQGSVLDTKSNARRRLITQ
jgi:hypothetical protein